jgi:hypothetical protein
MKYITTPYVNILSGPISSYVNILSGLILHFRCKSIFLGHINVVIFINNSVTDLQFNLLNCLITYQNLCNNTGKIN